MLMYPQIDPVMLALGPLKIHWYGFMYLLAFSSGWALGVHRARQPGSPYTPEQISDLVFYVAVGAVLGGRLGYVLFYNLPVYLADPLAIFKVWHGGMSFHGGLLGVLLAVWLFARKQQQGFWASTDFLAPLVPTGLAFGRIGNFINGELWGAPTTLPWGMVFPHVDNQPRHPSQLYEFALEGVALFILLWWFSRKPRPTMAVSGLFLIGYGSFRFLVELVRMPDPQLGYLAFGWLTMGQLLTLPMIIFGILLMTWAYRTAAKAKATQTNVE